MSTTADVGAVGQKACPHCQNGAWLQWDAIPNLWDTELSPGVIPTAKIMVYMCRLSFQST
jgi:hypothetical protein